MNDRSLLERAAGEHFAANSLEPESWIAKARGLIEAAQCLEDTLVAPKFRNGKSDSGWRPSADGRFLNHNGVCLMLRAYALENLCKAILIRTLPEAERQVIIDGSLAKSATGHDLPTLFERAGLEVNDFERSQLERLTEASTWFGRYPMPLNSAVRRLEEPEARRHLNELDVINVDLAVTKALIDRALTRASGA
jgi:hypothetical protein